MISVLKPCAVRPFQVHAQQHLRPVLGLGAAGSGLDVEERAVRVHLARKHALELETLHCRGQLHDIRLDFVGRPRVRLFSRELEQFPGVAQAARQLVQAADDLFQFGALASELLRAFRVVPDARLFELAGYFFETLVLVVVIKDTPSRSRGVPRDL